LKEKTYRLSDPNYRLLLLDKINEYKKYKSDVRKQNS